MKKGIILIVVFAFVIGTVTWSACIPHKHTYDNIPISIKNSWYISDTPYDDSYSYIPQIMTTPDKTAVVAEPGPTITAGIFLDLEITNHSNKTIKNIRAYYNYYVYMQNGEFAGSSDHAGANLLWDAGVISFRNYGYSSLTLRSGETKTVRLFVANVFYSSELSIEEYIDNYYNRIETDLYISWIQYSGLFGGQWGHAFGITQWENSTQWSLDGNMSVNRPNPTDAVKIEIEPFQR